jgi:hypothetical protein
MVVTVYVPILKARRSEFLALDHAEPPVAAAIRPLLEVMQNPSGSLSGSVLEFGQQLTEAAPKGMIFAVDCRYLRPTAHSEMDESPLSLVAWHIHDQGIRMIPVFSPGDGQNPRDVREAAALHRAGGCLRLGLQHLAQVSREDSSGRVPELLEATGLPSAEVDLVIDLGEVCTHLARERAARLGRAALSWARRHLWRSVTVAAGAFPGDVGDFPVGTFTPVSRWDAYLWSALAGPPMSREEIGYGDYAVSNPRVLDSWSPLPNLRYTSKRHWHIYRYPRSATGALSTFRDLCQAVISSGHWPELGGEFSWGDKQIEEIARRHGGPGDATLWRAFGTSHHMAVVVDRLERIGEP